MDEYNQSYYDQNAQTGTTDSRSYVGQTIDSTQDIKAKETAKNEKRKEFLEKATLNKEKRDTFLANADADIDSNGSLNEAQKSMAKDSVRSNLALVENVLDPAFKFAVGTGSVIAKGAAGLAQLANEGIIGLGELASLIGFPIAQTIDSGFLVFGDNETSDAAKGRIMERIEDAKAEKPKQFLESTGKEIIENDDGSYSTEKTITIESMELFYH